MRFCVIRLSSLGDLVITTSFLKALKGKFPDCKITYITKDIFFDLFKYIPFVDELVDYRKIDKIKGIRFDAVYDLQVNMHSILISLLLKGKVHRAKKHRLYRLKALHKGDFIWRFLKDKKEKDIVEDYLELILQKNYVKPELDCKKNLSGNLIIGLAPFAAWNNKMWPIENFIELIKVADKELQHPIFTIFGAQEEKVLAKPFKNLSYNIENYVGKLKLDQVVEKIGLCNAFVANDSGLMHIANACDIPLVAIFGPTVREFGFYPRINTIIIEKQLYCRPCHLHGGDVCKEGHFRCMKDIQVKEVFEALRDLLEVKK